MANMLMELKSHKVDYLSTNNDASDLGILEFFGFQNDLAKPFFVQIRSVKNPVIKGEYLKTDKHSEVEGKVYLYFDEIAFEKVWNIVSCSAPVFLDLSISESEHFRFDRHGEIIYSKNYAFKDASIKLGTVQNKEWVY